jgi:tRNA threonylcarbamoyl adenosine modification protein YeaZ
MLLAIDTSAGASVAIVDRDAGIIAEFGESDTRRHAEVIGTLIRAVLDESGAAVADLSGIAIGMGPGPFTGLRVGIAAARAFAFGAGKPVVPVVSHDAVAYAMAKSGVARPLLVVTDARRKEVYWSSYSGVDPEGLPIRDGGPGLARPEFLAEIVPVYSTLERVDAAEISAGALGMVAELMFLHHRPFAGNEALYLRSPDVTLSAGPKRVS